MKGYPTNFGYLGWIWNGCMLFPTEQEYKEYYKENKL